jgi:CubicO group peptidase (beta-lactamase class C family)
MVLVASAGNAHTRWRLVVLLLRVVPLGAQLGPGRGPWQRGSPAAHGLSAAKLDAAAAHVAAIAPTRDCLLVVKDGVLIHESYPRGSASRAAQYETDSLGKIFTAGVIGAAVQAGLVDIDRPLSQYDGLAPSAVWNRTGVDRWPRVTARHLLNQMSGYGLAEPGSLFSYDSDAYIQELSSLLRATAPNHSALGFARRAFAEPLGVPGLFDFDGAGADISAGGGQMASCREIARAGQLVLNGGKWLGVDGKAVVQVLDEEYTKQMLRPAKPGVVEGYGFLTWLNTDMGRHEDSSSEGPTPPRSHCCAPRWIGGVSPRGLPPPLGSRACSGELCGVCCAPRNGTEPLPCEPSLPVLLDRTNAPPSDPWNSTHERDPSEHVSSQIIGDSFPEVDRPTPGGPLSPPDLAMAMGAYAKYMFLLPSTSTLVVSMGFTFGKSMGCPGGYDDGFTLSMIWRALAEALQPHVDATAAAAPAPPVAGPGASGTESETVDRDGSGGGSCRCYCPPGQGFGRCVNATSATACKLAAVVGAPAGVCPSMGVTQQCESPADADFDLCNNRTELQQWQRSHGVANCTQTQACTLAGGAKVLATAACVCTPTKWSSCGWRPEPCPYGSPYWRPPQKADDGALTGSSSSRLRCR